MCVWLVFQLPFRHCSAVLVAFELIKSFVAGIAGHHLKFRLGLHDLMSFVLHFQVHPPRVCIEELCVFWYPCLQVCLGSV